MLQLAHLSGTHAEISQEQHLDQLDSNFCTGKVLHSPPRHIFILFPEKKKKQKATGFVDKLPSNSEVQFARLLQAGCTKNQNKPKNALPTQDFSWSPKLGIFLKLYSFYLRYAFFLSIYLNSFSLQNISNLKMFLAMIKYQVNKFQ